jgi:hypothetical protein
MCVLVDAQTFTKDGLAIGTSYYNLAGLLHPKPFYKLKP